MRINWKKQSLICILIAWSLLIHSTIKNLPAQQSISILINLFFNFFSFFFFRFFFFFISYFIEFRTNDDLFYEKSARGNPILVLNYNRYVRNRESKKRVFWRCTKYYQNHINCPGSVAVTKVDDFGVIQINVTRQHNELCEIRRQLDEQQKKIYRNRFKKQ